MKDLLASDPSTSLRVNEWPATAGRPAASSGKGGCAGRTRRAAWAGAGRSGWGGGREGEWAGRRGWGSTNTGKDSMVGMD